MPESGLQIREIADDWQISTRAEFHEEIRAFLKTRPSAKLSIPALETLAVIAYKHTSYTHQILPTIYDMEDGWQILNREKDQDEILAAY